MAEGTIAKAGVRQKATRAAPGNGKAPPGDSLSSDLAAAHQNALLSLSKLEDSLWAAADNLRANSKLTSSEYCMPVLGVIFLRHATNRYDAASRQIAEEQAAGKNAQAPAGEAGLHQAPGAHAAERSPLRRAAQAAQGRPTSARPSSRP